MQYTPHTYITYTQLHAICHLQFRGACLERSLVSYSPLGCSPGKEAEAHFDRLEQFLRALERDPRKFQMTIEAARMMLGSRSFYIVHVISHMYIYIRIIHIIDACIHTCMYVYIYIIIYIYMYAHKYIPIHLHRMLYDLSLSAGSARQPAQDLGSRAHPGPPAPQWRPGPCPPPAPAEACRPARQPLGRATEGLFAVLGPLQGW